MKPVLDESGREYCGKCREPVTFFTLTGGLLVGISEFYYDYNWKKYNFCPSCGEKVDRDD